jgi:hypothetical protein
MNVGESLRRRPGRIATALGLLLLAGCAGDPATLTRSASQVQLIAPADLAEVGQVRDPEELEGLGLALDPLPDDAALVGSHYAVALAGVAAADQLSYDQLRALNLHTTFPEAQSAPMQAGSGREFLVVYLTEPDSAASVLGGDSAEVIVDGEARPLDVVPHAQEAIVVSVPAGGDAVLAITDAGETKTISLRTGGRDSGDREDHPADALQGAAVALEEGVAISGVSPPGQADGLQIQVSLSPSGHLDEQGWAADGQMWLEIDFELTMAGLTAEQAELRLDLAQSLTIVASDGTRVAIPGDPVVEPVIIAAGGLAVAEWSGVAGVPDTLRNFEVSYATHGTFTAPGGQELSFSRHEVTPTGTIELTER